MELTKMFGRLTRWAIVFLIIFVLFVLLVPEEREYGGYTGAVSCGC
jgi:hypothetical protein